MQHIAELPRVAPKSVVLAEDHRVSVRGEVLDVQEVPIPDRPPAGNVEVAVPPVLHEDPSAAFRSQQRFAVGGYTLDPSSMQDRGCDVDE